VGGVRFDLTMDDWLARRLDRLYADGQAHDAGQSDRLSRRRNLEPPSASLLAQLVRISAARAVVEIGTSNGYSTIWLADAAVAVGGQVVSVDNVSIEAARENLADAGLADVVDLVVADGGAFLAQAPTAGIDLLFLDAERTAYLAWWPDVQRVLRPGGLLVVDNALAPDPAELSDLLVAIAATDHWIGDVVPVGKGLFLAWKAIAGPNR
jgi:predicted O-methyltransferase YrrM